MGQVELNIMGSMEKLQNCILMHVDDINDINALILVSRSNDNPSDINLLITMNF